MRKKMMKISEEKKEKESEGGYGGSQEGTGSSFNNEYL
jgi:hypothetical protein